jgi:hypothetical protein
MLYHITLSRLIIIMAMVIILLLRLHLPVVIGMKKEVLLWKEV